jgi:methyl-accepting chemotaxis protein
VLTVRSGLRIRRGRIVQPLSALLARLTAPDAIADLTGRLEAPGLSPAEAELQDRFNAFLDLVHRDLTDLARASNDASRGAAANTHLLGQIATAAQEQSDRTVEISAAVHELAQAAQVVAQSSEATRALTTDVGNASRDALETLERTIERLDELRAKAEQALVGVRTVVDRSRQIDEVTGVIEEISARTNLLAINASIEAAHAGDSGRGFAVVAAEIKRLADSTKKSARDIATLIGSVGGAIESARVATQQNAENVVEFSGESLEVREDLTRVTEIVITAGDQVSAIAAAVEQQSATLRAVSGNIEELSRHAQESAKHAAAARNLDLSAINSSVFSVIGRYRLGTFLDQVRDWAESFAQSVEAVLESTVASGRASLSDVLEFSYEEYTPVTARSLSRLFKVDRLSAAGFTPPKYRSRVDHLFDAALMPLCDTCADRDPRIVYATVHDINGLSIMSARALRQDITGDPAKDLVGNRIKRIFDDDLGLRSARVALGAQGARIPKRAPRKAFVDGGVDLRRPAGLRRWLMQTYARDTGEILDDFSMPLYCRDQRWGSIRVGFEPVV